MIEGLLTGFFGGLFYVTKCFLMGFCGTLALVLGGYGLYKGIKLIFGGKDESI